MAQEKLKFMADDELVAGAQPLSDDISGSRVSTLTLRASRRSNAATFLTVSTQTKSRRIVWTCVILSGLWLAAATAALLILHANGLLQRIDAINLGAIAAGCFAPLTAIWLAGLALLRGGPLAEIEERLQTQLLALARPVEDASLRAGQLERRLQRQVDQIDMAATTATSRFAELEAAAARQAERLIDAAGALEHSRTAAVAAEQRLRRSMDDFEQLIARLADVAPQVQSRLAEAGGQVAESTRQLTAAAETVSQHSARFAESATRLRHDAGQTEQQLVTSADRLADRLHQLRREADGAVDRIDTSVVAAETLLERSATWADGQVNALTQGADRSARLLDETARALSAQMNEVAATVTAQFAHARDSAADDLGRLARTLGTEVETLRQNLSALAAETDQTGVAIGLRLLDAVTRTRRAAQEAVSAAETAARSVTRTMSGQLDAVAAQVEARSAQAASVLQQQTEALHGLLARVEALASATEARLAARTEEDLSRVANQLIDSLNSTTIDIARLFALEVPETDWQAYLGGDRAVFARRLVKSGDRELPARIGQRMAREPEFRDAVGRYISLFEALFGRILAEGSGQALGITILSSDLGRLYVLLAQVTRRLPR